MPRRRGRPKSRVKKIRTTIYIPKTYHKFARESDLNLSRILTRNLRSIRKKRRRKK